jgi:putative ABC transport system substrate-binding protein
MRNGIWLLALGLVLYAGSSAQAERTHRISALVADDQFIPAVEGFKKKMAELGYVEGRNIRYDFYNSKGDRGALEAMAEKILRNKPDLIVTSSTTATAPVAKATHGSQLPVVFLSAGNPLKLVKSYASSGNNLTGVASTSLDLMEKRLELLKEIAPWVKRVIAFGIPGGVNYQAGERLMQEAARRVGFVVVPVPVAPEEIKNNIPVFITRKYGEAVVPAPDAQGSPFIGDIAAQAVKEKVLSLGPNIETVKRGFLAAYSTDYFASGQQGAAMVDKILKGARPAELPIEQPVKLKLFLNLKTAKAIRLKIPRDVLLRTDEVIE